MSIIIRMVFVFVNILCEFLDCICAKRFSFPFYHDRGSHSVYFHFTQEDDFEVISDPANLDVPLTCF